MDFRILGELEVLRHGDPIEIGSPRQRALLARLLISAPNTVSTDRLVDDLWRGDPPDSARHTLHVYISRLRRDFGDDGERLHRHGSGYRVNIEPDELDANRFAKLATAGRDALVRNDAETATELLTEALALWRGTALCEFVDDRFALDEADRLEELRLATVEQKLWADLDRGQHTTAAVELRELVARYPLREMFWEQLMLTLYRCGRQAEALRVFQSARVVLADELGIDPGAALRNLEDRILVQDPSLLLDAGMPVVRKTSNLPVQRTGFIGRTEELARGGELLRESRLLTFTGPPGSGKTRLAIELARRQASSFSHGVFYVPLATISETRHVAAAIGTALGLHDVPRETPLQSAKAFLADRQALVVFDNFEHVLPAATDLGEILDVAPDVTILVTSRVPLRIEGEQRFPVPPLQVPPRSMRGDLKAIREYDATALFVTRARAVDPAFGADATNSPAIAAIAERLEGLPLAIELAAARTQVLTPAELLARLEPRLALLNSGPSDVDQRHRTMRNAIAWSYELLEPRERPVFRKLGAFVGGFTLDAAAAVAEVDDMSAVDTVDSLLTQNLLYRPVTVGPARYSMLEMTREYALELLTAAGESAATKERHATYYMRLAEDTEPQLTADPGGPGSRRLEDEIANLRAALGYSRTGERPDLGLSLASSIWRFWQSSERLTEGREWLGELLEVSDTDTDAHAKGLNALAGLAYWQAEYNEAERIYLDLLDYYRSVGNKAAEADTLYALSLTVMWHQDTERGEKYATESRALFEEVDSKPGIGRAMLAEASVLWWKHDYEPARSLWVEALQIARNHNDLPLVLTQLAGLAALTYHVGRHEEALEVALQGLGEARQADNEHMTVWMLDLIASFSAAAAPVEAVKLSGAVAALRDKAGGGVLPEFLEVQDARSVAAAHIEIEILDKAWRDGWRTDLAEAVKLALRLGSSRLPASQ